MRELLHDSAPGIERRPPAAVAVLARQELGMSLVAAFRSIAWPVCGRRAAILAVSSFIMTGCVERRMTIRSDPPNALVVLDGQEIGHTPVSTSFVYYGEREIKLVKDGYETKTVKQKIATPWYQVFPIDFISEALVPARIRDERNYVYSLEPVVNVPNNQLVDRAEALRAQGTAPPPEVIQRARLSDDRPVQR